MRGRAEGANFLEEVLLGITCQSTLGAEGANFLEEVLLGITCQSTLGADGANFLEKKEVFACNRIF